MTINRTFDIVDKLKADSPKRIVLSVKRNGKWENFTGEDFVEYRDNFSLGLLALGIKKGDKILTISNNRPEWNFIDMGMSQIGAVHVPVYPNMGVIEYDYIIEHSDAKIVIASSDIYYNKIKASADKSTKVEKIYTFDNVDGVANWNEILELGKKEKDKYSAELKKIKDSITEKDLLTIIYTSGTTGRSKGVMLSQQNLVANVKATAKIMPVYPEDKYLSFLPLCHVLERMVNYLVMYNGAAVYYAESIETIGDDLKDVKPNGFTSVPRVLEKLYDKIIVKGKELSGIKRTIFFWAVDIALKYENDGSSSAFYNFQYKIADKLIFSKWREALGGNIKVIISGGAALQERLSRSFNAAGIPVMEGYGMTETSPVISVNYVGKGNMKFGSVGPIIKNVEVKIDDDGEICMKGPNQMIGYYKNEEKTKETIDNDGWLHTGDIGRVDEDNFLWITDRKKEIFKLSTGKYVAPQILENRAKESNFIEQILVVGEGEKFTAAIISPSFEYLHNWCFHKHINYRDNEELVMNKQVISRYQEEVDKINKNLGKSRQIRKWALTCREWTPETKELSPTLKLKRKYLKELYSPKLNFLYGYSDEFGNLGCRKKKQ